MKSVHFIIRPQAQQDIIEIIDYIAEDNLDAAEHFYPSVQRTARSIAQMPRAYPALYFYKNIRHRSVLDFSRYRLFYKINNDDTIDVVAVLHSSRHISNLFNR